MTETTHYQKTSDERGRWISILASSTRAELDDVWEALPDKPGFHWVRKPEFGSVMARARANRSGSQFNFADVSVTRCSLKTTDGYLGVAYVVGRDKRHAALAALLDACLQRPAHHESLKASIRSLAAAIEARRKAKVARAYSTRVEFSESIDSI